MLPVVTPPFGAPPCWFAVVVERAGGRCECSGQCGIAHSKTGCRCPLRHGGWNGHWDIVLVAAPREFGLPPSVAATLPIAELLAWCPRCLDGARRRAAAAAGRQRPDAPPLFEIPGAVDQRSP